MIYCEPAGSTKNETAIAGEAPPHVDAMAAHVLIQGTLFRAPEERTGKVSGKNFVVATLKVRDGDDAQFWRVLAFSGTAQTELLRLEDGDALAVQGGLRAEAYEKDGELRVGLTVLADAILPLRQPKKPREPSMTNRAWGAASRDGAIPF
jgi:single-stranded DNA-binding protein